MKTIIAGSRSITDYETVKQAVISSRFKITEVVSGTARGVDTLGERWAIENGVPLKTFPANWSAHGKAAGHMRNQVMADYADALVLVWDGHSRGSADMLARAVRGGLKVFASEDSVAEIDATGERIGLTPTT